MGSARDLVELHGRLNRERESIDLFSIEAVNELTKRTDFERVSRSVPGAPEAKSAIALLCLQALRIQASELEPRIADAEFAVTLPSVVASAARPTHQIIREMLDGTREDVIALGYEISDTGVLELLQRASADSAHVVLVCDRGKGTGPRILETWPSACAPPIVFQDIAREDAAPFASMHGKALVVGDSDLLITSANFTFHGLRGNIEFGVRLRGAPAKQAREILRQIIVSGVLERVGPPRSPC